MKQHPVQLNLNGCPRAVRFMIMERVNGLVEIHESYCSIIGVQKYLDSRSRFERPMEQGFPVKCRFYLRGVGEQEHSTLKEKWDEGLSIRELVEYLND